MIFLYVFGCGGNTRRTQLYEREAGNIQNRMNKHLKEGEELQKQEAAVWGVGRKISGRRKS